MYLTVYIHDTYVISICTQMNRDGGTKLQHAVFICIFICSYKFLSKMVEHKRCKKINVSTKKLQLAALTHAAIFVNMSVICYFESYVINKTLQVSFA